MGNKKKQTAAHEFYRTWMAMFEYSLHSAWWQGAIRGMEPREYYLKYIADAKAVYTKRKDDLNTWYAAQLARFGGEPIHTNGVIEKIVDELLAAQSPTT